jgi:hypothetical protein
MEHLEPAQVEQLARHPTLRRASMSTGGGKDDALAALLPLPRADRAGPYPVYVF